MSNLFEDNGAKFSECRKYRYALWRKWDTEKPLIMFIGLNPSTANETEPDNTVTRVRGFAHKWGYGGFYMMNCFPYVSTNPDDLWDCSNIPLNDVWLKRAAAACKEIIFAWGSFDIIKLKKRDQELIAMFPDAKALVINKDGSPRHPLYVKGSTIPVRFSSTAPQ